MNIRHIAAALAMTAAVLTAGSGFAGSFDARLAEAKAASGNVLTDQDTRSTISSHLSMAESLDARGQEARAVPYLNVARGLLGLPAQPHAQSQTAEKTSDAGIAGN